MPMKNNSTLRFFVKSFPGLPENAPDHPGNTFENGLNEADGLSPSPSAESVRKILDFAMAYDVVETDTAGCVEMNLN